MWLPTRVYKRIPQFWFLMGLLFIATGLYLGIEFVVSLGYIAVGFVCCAFGAGIEIVRKRRRKDASSDTESSASTE